MNKLIQQKVSCPVLLLSILIATFANTAVITQTLVALNIGFSGSVMTTLYVGTVLCIGVISYFYKRKLGIRVNRENVLIAIILLLYYLFTRLIVGAPSIDFQYFFVFCICSLLIPSITVIDNRTFFRTSVLCTAPTFFVSNTIFMLDYNGELNMGMSYALLTPAVMTIVYLKFFWNSERKKIKFVMLALSILSLYPVLMVFQNGSRGVVVCISLLILFMQVVRVDGHKITVKKKKFFIYFIMMIIVVSSYQSVFILIKNLLASYDTNFHFIDKILNMKSNGDISNGRNDLYILTMKGICDSPFIGHGLDRFEANTCHNYPHNFILQLAYDTGVPITIYILVKIYKMLKRTFEYNNKADFLLVWALFFASVPGALFSDNLWNNRALWLFFGFLFVLNKTNSVRR